MKIICVGRNYTEHIEELENNRPEEPVLFLKPDSAILQRNHPFFIPSFTENVHYEAELIVRINRLGKSIPERFAHKYYSQISVGLDFTARDVQAKLKENSLPWERAKAFDGSAVIGKWLDLKDRGIDDLNFSLLKNGEVAQKGNTAQMLWKVNELIAEVSKIFTLKIGDILFTGTPSGVGPVAIGDELKGYLEQEEVFSVKVK